MLDIKMVRANPDLVKQAMKTRNKDMDAQVDRVIAIDAERRELSAKADGVKARQNAASKDIARLKKENIDFVYYGGYYPEMGQMLRQARSVGLKTQFMGPEGVGNASLSNIAGDAAEGMLVTMPKRYDQDPANQGIVDALKADKKDPSGPYFWITYAAVQALATALERTGSDEPLALVKDLKANGANTVIGPLNWDEKGDLKGFDFGVFQWHADGSSTAAK